MNLTLFLPGAIVLLKAILRVSVDRPVSSLAVVKGMIFFPLDIVFLTFSYVLASDILRSAQIGLDTFRFPILVAVMFFVSALIVAVACSKCDKLFDAGRIILAATFSFITYLISLFLLFAFVGASVSTGITS